MPASFPALVASPEPIATRGMVNQQMNGKDLLLGCMVAAACNAMKPCIHVCTCRLHKVLACFVLLAAHCIAPGRGSMYSVFTLGKCGPFAACYSMLTLGLR